VVKYLVTRKIAGLTGIEKKIMIGQLMSTQQNLITGCLLAPFPKEKRNYLREAIYSIIRKGGNGGWEIMSRSMVIIITMKKKEHKDNQ
jgi:hypothetical protein